MSEFAVLTWNLFHGRSVPGCGRELLAEFAHQLRSWEWDAALLQEVPPWWPAQLGYHYRVALTSRNALLPLRRYVAERQPDLIKSNGGGANAILVRAGAIEEHRIRRLCIFPERRWLHAVRLGELWVANVHAAASAEQARLAAATTLAWAAGAPAVLGGDFNLRSPQLEGFEWAGGTNVDHVFVRGWRAASSFRVLAHGELSDHAPVLVSVRGSQG